MSVNEFAELILNACDDINVSHMLTGALAYNLYGIPRSTKDIDIVVNMESGDPIRLLMERLDSEVEFDPRVQFDTITWGRRQVGVAKEVPIKVEFFELFDDPFVLEQFERKRKMYCEFLCREAWLPTAEDVIVQKLRWARPKDLEDARDVIAIQGDVLDMDYIKKWCTKHKSIDRLNTLIDEMPDFE